MLRQPRLWAGLCAALLLTLPLTGRADPVKFYPNNTEIVVTFDIQQVLNSELIKSKKELLEGAKGHIEGKVPEDAKKWIDDLGIDFFKDIHSLTVATAFSKEPQKDALMLVSGKFNKEKFAATAEKAAKQFADVVKADKIGKHTLYAVTPPNDKGTGYICLLDDKTIAISGNEDAIKEAIARAGGKKGKLPKELGQLIESNDAKQSFNLMITNGGLIKMLEEAKKANPQVEAAEGTLKELDGVGAGITLTKDINFHLGVLAKSAEDAKNHAKMANLFILPLIKNAVAQRAAQDEKLVPANDIVKTLRITSQGSGVYLRGQVTAATLEKALKMIPGFPGN